MPPLWLSQGSVARRSSVPRARPQQASTLERRERAHDGGGVAGDHPGGVTADGRFIAGLGGEGVARSLVLLTALEDELESPTTVDLHVLRRHFFGRAIYDHVRRFQQVVQGASHLQPGLAHGLSVLRRGAEEPEALADGYAGAPVAVHIANACQDHVILGHYCVRHALADDAVAVDGHPNLTVCTHHILLCFAGGFTPGTPVRSHRFLFENSWSAPGTCAPR